MRRNAIAERLIIFLPPARSVSPAPLEHVSCTAKAVSGGRSGFGPHVFFKAISCLQFLHSTYKRYISGPSAISTSPRMAGFIITNVDLFSHKGRYDHSQ